MNKQEISILSADNKTDLHVIIWEPDGDTNAVIQLVHGMAEYIDRYHEFAAYLTTKGFAVIGHDHLGHGQSVRKKEDLGFFSDGGPDIIIEDMHSVTVEAKKRWAGKKLFLLGHSMGSFMARYYMTRYSEELDGIVIMGTGFIPAFLAGLGQKVSKAVILRKGKMYRSGLLTAMALGSNNKPFRPNRTEVDWLSRNDENVDKYVADPLCGFWFTAGAYLDFFSVMKKLADGENFDQIRKGLPVLIISGENDPVGGKAACPKVKASLDAIGMTDVEMKLYPDDRHEILNEIDRDNVYADIKNWFERKM